MVVGVLLALISITTILAYLYYRKNETYFKLGNGLPGPHYLETVKRYFDTTKPPTESKLN